MSITILSITIYSLLAMMSNESFEMTHCELFAILSKLIKCDSGYPSIVDPSIGENGSAWRKRCRVAKTVLRGENVFAWRKRVCVAKTGLRGENGTAWRKRRIVAKAGGRVANTAHRGEKSPWRKCIPPQMSCAQREMRTLVARME